MPGRTISSVPQTIGRLVRSQLPRPGCRTAAMESTRRPSSRPASFPFVDLMDDAHNRLPCERVGLIGIEPVHERQVQTYPGALDECGHTDGHSMGGHVEVTPADDRHDG